MEIPTVFLVSILTLSHCTVPYCPQTQRYDVTQFPPRCMNCSEIIPNRLSLSQIRTTLKIRPTVKFSPGLPQNSTCGCWRPPPTNQVIINAALNASWVVSGLIFQSNTQSQWIKQVQINASADNVTFIDWGNYTASNFTDITLFSYPIRAKFFRITVLRYVNHRINATSGFPVSISALVSQAQPFGCRCPLLSNGACCPFMNMTVRNDTCVWCMDPGEISTVMVDGCGRCRTGTFENQGRCVYRRTASPSNHLRVVNPASDGVYWTAEIELSQDPRTVITMYLNATTWIEIARDHDALSRLAAPIISTQYIQFDRGRYTLNMTHPVIDSWATCLSPTTCTGILGVQFITIFPDGANRTQTQQYPIRFDFGIPNLITTINTEQIVSLTKLEIHSFNNTQWALRIVGIRMRGNYIDIQWDSDPPIRVEYTGDNFTIIDKPPDTWNSLRVIEGLSNGTTLAIQQPVRVVAHNSQTLMQYIGISVSIQYGFAFKNQPSPGDSEQIIFISAKSLQPIRLKNLAILSSGFTVQYTNPIGSIIDPNRVLDLNTACTKPATILKWLTQAMLILSDNPPQMVLEFVRTSCQKSATASKAYWIAPSRAQTSRTISYQMGIVAEFA